MTPEPTRSEDISKFAQIGQLVLEELSRTSNRDEIGHMNADRARSSDCDPTEDHPIKVSSPLSWSKGLRSLECRIDPYGTRERGDEASNFARSQSIEVQPRARDLHSEHEGGRRVPEGPEPPDPLRYQDAPRSSS